MPYIMTTEQHHQETAQAAPPPSSTAAEPAASDPVLHRLKELEESNVNNAKALEKMRKELQEKEDKIKILSADKRKEMEGILSSAIDSWLNSLSGVSDENKTNFRQGISKLAEHADMNNAAWEIVCNASALHNNNVKKIEELLAQAQDRERELGDLKGFKSEASRISGVKRSRTDDPIPQPPSHKRPPAEEEGSGGGSSNNTWDMFQNMITRDFKSQYF
jgi:hypothetical protein